MDLSDLLQRTKEIGIIVSSKEKEFLLTEEKLQGLMQDSEFLRKLPKNIIDTVNTFRTNAEKAGLSEVDVLKEIGEVQEENIKIDNLTPWQKELIQRLCNKKGIIRFCLFEKDGIDSFWVIVKEASTEFVLECSKEYCNVLDKYPDINCDFMVYGKDEICGVMLPPDAIVINAYY